MFRGKESSNRIELSRLVQDLSNFGVLGSLQLWEGAGGWEFIWRNGGITTCILVFWALCGSGEGAGGWMAWGVSPHTCTCTHAHLYMYRNCKWPPTWRHPCLACLTYMCMCAWDTSPHTHTHPHSHPPICHPPGGGPSESLKIR